MRYTKDFGVVDMYKHYKELMKEKGKEAVDEKTYRKIIREYNKEVTRLIVEESEEFRLPFRLGYLRIKKFKTNLKLDHDGNIKLHKLKVNWQATKKLWEENEEAKELKKLVYHTNRHTQGYVFKWFWDKYTSNVKNKTVYSLVMTRHNKRHLAHTVKNNENIDYYE